MLVILKTYIVYYHLHDYHQNVWMWIFGSITSVIVSLKISSRYYKKMYPEMKLISTELVLIPFGFVCIFFTLYFIWLQVSQHVVSQSALRSQQLSQQSFIRQLFHTPPEWVRVTKSKTREVVYYIHIVRDPYECPKIPLTKSDS